MVVPTEVADLLKDIRDHQEVQEQNNNEVESNDGNLDVDYQSGSDEDERRPDVCEDAFKDMSNEEADEQIPKLVSDEEQNMENDVENLGEECQINDDSNNDTFCGFCYDN